MLEKSNDKSSKSRQRLSKLLREGGELFTVDQAAGILGISNEDAVKTLTRWRNQGWLTRIKRGIYAAVPVEAENNERALEDAWILIPDLFGAAYVGGWSAAEYWDLTEQIFKDICVFTTRPVTKNIKTYHNVSFVTTHIPVKDQFGTRPVWKKEKKILVSDPSRTIIDMLSIPWTGGGIQHVADCLKEYFKSKHFDENLLITYALQLGNGAVFKRLGFFASQMFGEDHPLTMRCLEHLSKGNAKLDPEQKADKLVTKWRLFIPSNLQIGNASQ